MKSSYFSPTQWLIIILMAICGALMNIYLPVKDITEELNIPGPAAGMALFGGFIFVLWVSLARIITGRKYAGLITSLLLGCFCLFFRPWYGVISPPWFSIYGIVSLFALGLCVELTQGRWRLIGGGLGNLLCLGITWLSLGFHVHTWVPLNFVPLLLLASFISGMLGALLALGMASLIEPNMAKRA